MDVTAALDAAVAPDVLFEVVADLGTYPDWLDIVPLARPAEPASGDEGPAWSVDLRGQLGPLRRSKRLRMVRTTAEPAELVVFERRELDEREHSPWVMTARIGPVASTDAAAPVTSRLTMQLHYGGSMWMPMLDRLLADEIERSRGRLLALLGVSS